MEMKLFMDLTPMVMGLYFFTFSFLSSTKNIRSAIIFKFIPFILGLSGVFVSFKSMGLL